MKWYMSQAGPHEMWHIVLFRPTIESVLFADPAIVRDLLDADLDESQKVRAEYDPKRVLSDLLREARKSGGVFLERFRQDEIQLGGPCNEIAGCAGIKRVCEPALRASRRLTTGPILESSTVVLEKNGVQVVDTFAEAFPITGTRVIITAISAEWARIAATVMTGNATSVIACDVEAAIERELGAEETPDGRPGIAVLVFAFSRDALGKARSPAGSARAY